MQAVDVPQESRDLLRRSGNYVQEYSPVLVYCLEDVDKSLVLRKCTEAEDSYASDTFGPGLEELREDIFDKAVTVVQDCNDCVGHFLCRLERILEQTPTGRHNEVTELPIYSGAFVLFTGKDLPDTVIMFVALEIENKEWTFVPCKMPVNVEVGMELASLRRVDKFPETIVEHHGDPAVLSRLPKPRIPEKGSPESWTFALFSTGLEDAFSLDSSIDPEVDIAPPNMRSLDFVPNPLSNTYVMSWETAKSTFPVRCRDTQKAEPFKMHHHLFICCDNEEPQTKGLLLVKMEWDGNIDRSDEELRAVGRQAMCMETRVELDQCLEKAR